MARTETLHEPYGYISYEAPDSSRGNVATQRPLAPPCSQNSFEQPQGNNVWAKLHFYVPPADGSDPVFVTDSAGVGTKNYTHEGHMVLIRDIRPNLRQFSLNGNAFTAVTGLDPLIGPFTDEAREWKLQTEKVLLDSIPDSEKVVIFDYLVRRAEPQELFSRPVRKVHIDQTAQAAWQRALQRLPTTDYDMVCAGALRMRIINVWRSIDQTVDDHPIAFADSSTLQDGDLIKVHRIFPGREGQTYAVRHNGDQQFW